MTYQQNPDGQYTPSQTQPSDAKGFWRTHMQNTYLNDLKSQDPQLAAIAESFLSLPPAEQRKVVAQGLKLGATAATGNVKGAVGQYAQNAGIGV